MRYLQWVYKRLLGEDKVLLWIFAIAAFLHILSFAGAAIRGTGFSAVQDPLEYRLIAENLAAGHGFSIFGGIPDVLRTPLYPLFLAASIALFNSVAPLILLQQFFILGAALIVVALCAMHQASRWATRFAAAFILFETTLWFLSLQTMTETIAAFLVVVLFFICVSPLRSLSMYQNAVLTGVVSGLLVLTKPSLLLLVAFGVCAFAYVADDSWRSRLYAAASVALVCVLIVSPWIYRNYRVTGHAILSSSFAVNLVNGFGTDEERARIYSGPAIYDAKGRAGVAFTSFTAPAYESVQAMATNDLKRVGLIGFVVPQVTHAYDMWYGHTYASVLKTSGIPVSLSLENRIIAIDYVVWSILLVLFISGLYWGAKQKPYATLLAVAFFAAVMVPNLLNSYYRYLLPLWPLIALYAGLGVDAVIAGVRNTARVMR